MTIQEWLGEDNKLGIDIWQKKYQHNNETFDEWLDRVSNGNKDLRQLIIDKKFLFGGRILSNRGLYKNGIKVSYSNCYVLSPPQDNIESIFKTAGELARTFSYGGGVGIDISKLAPKGAKVNNTAKQTSGAVSFMDLYSLVTGLIGQNGRRGALMISLDCSHPDIEEFLEIKSDLDKITKANISIRVTDDFINAIKNKEMYTLSFTREESGEVIEREIDAYKFFKRFAEMNWDYAEPAFLYWDNITKYNLLSEYEDFEYAGCNPCAEEPLPENGSCLLGSINLSEFVKNGEFDFDDFAYTVSISTIALNEVLDEGLPLHPLEAQRNTVRDWRQIGLGIFGLSDMLIKMKIPYDSEKAFILCDCIGSLMINMSVQSSSLLARKDGSFPKYNYEDTSKSLFFIKTLNDETKAMVRKYGLRNSQLLTIAPTGTLSTMLGVSGGIEPIFANYYERKTESLHGKDVYYKVYTPIVEKYMKDNNIVDDKYLPSYFITSKDISYTNRINMQATWQNYIDASISSTVNVPSEFTVEEVMDLYLLANDMGLKGITIYRDGCKRSGILTTATESKEKEVNNVDELTISNKNSIPWGTIINADNNVIGKKRKLMSGCGSLYVLAYFDEETGQLLETYINKGSSGTCLNNLTAISRLMSTMARAGVGIDEIIDQLQSCGACPSYSVRSATKHDTSKGASCPIAIAYALKDMYDEIQNELFYLDEVEECDEIVEIKKEISLKSKCPNCSEELTFEGGCNICKACGWSKCD